MTVLFHIFKKKGVGEKTYHCVVLEFKSQREGGKQLDDCFCKGRCKEHSSRQGVVICVGVQVRYL